MNFATVPNSLSPAMTHYHDTINPHIKSMAAIAVNRGLLEDYYCEDFAIYLMKIFNAFYKKCGKLMGSTAWINLH